MEPVSSYPTRTPDRSPYPIRQACSDNEPCAQADASECNHLQAKRILLTLFVTGMIAIASIPFVHTLRFMSIENLMELPPKKKHVYCINVTVRVDSELKQKLDRLNQKADGMEWIRRILRMNLDALEQAGKL